MIDKKEQKRLADRAKERKYIKTKVRQVMVKFNLTTDERELFEYLYSQKNMQGYVKKLLRADMEQKKEFLNQRG
jgi:hypothetical protein